MKIVFELLGSKSGWSEKAFFTTKKGIFEYYEVYYCGLSVSFLFKGGEKCILIYMCHHQRPFTFAFNSIPNFFLSFIGNWEKNKFGHDFSL